MTICQWHSKVSIMQPLNTNYCFSRPEFWNEKEMVSKGRLLKGYTFTTKKETCVNIITGEKIDNSWNPILEDLYL